jgi:sortase A
VALLDAGLTLAWQEPVSGMLAARDQHRLDRQLEGTMARAARGRRRAPLAVLAARDAADVRRGEALGRLRIPALGRELVMTEGADPASLRRGPGHYEDTELPGEGGTVAVAGHRTTYGAPFRDVDDLRPGNAVVVEMPYGRFDYRVEHVKVLGPEATWVKRRAGEERLVLTACHPLYSAARRIVVFARLAGARPAAS